MDPTDETGPGEDAAPTAQTEPRRGEKAAWLLVTGIIGGLVLLIVGVVGALVLTGGDESAGEPQTVLIEVPPGTGERQKKGEQIQLMPDDLRLKVGDTLRIVNNDDVVQTVGPYTVGPGQALRQTYVEPGTIQGFCSLSASGIVTITISER